MKIKIGLIPLDYKLPSLPIMKLKSYYGNSAEIASPLFSSQYNKVYVSSIFDFSDKSVIPKGAICGGTGINVKSRLPIEIERCQPDYSIYPGCDFSYQRFTYGCVNRCPFCVAWKMGKFEDLNPMDLNSNGKWIYLLDNNLLVSENCIEHLKVLKSYDMPIQFEGIEAGRLAEMPNAIYLISKTKIKGQIHMAWDNPKINMEPIFKEILKTIPAYKIMVYVLIGYWSTIQEDLYRIESLRSLKIDPFVMPYDKLNKYQRALARYVNHKAIFRSTSWKDFKENLGWE